jgi:fluoroquinolone transport system permease protein
MQAALNIIQAGIDPTGLYEFTYEYYVSFGYIFSAGILLYIFLAVPKFQNYAVRQSGV